MESWRQKIKGCKLYDEKKKDDKRRKLFGMGEKRMQQRKTVWSKKTEMEKRKCKKKTPGQGREEASYRKKDVKCGREVKHERKKGGDGENMK